MVAPAPDTCYARTHEGGYLAYQVLGDGPMDVMVVPSGSVPIDVMWEEPAIAGAFERLASFSRVITLDLRGFGSSGPTDLRSLPAVQAWMDDLGALLAAVGSDRAACISWGEAALATMLFAATNPRQVTSLVLINSYARFLRNDECPWGLPAERLSDHCAELARIWGTTALGEITAPTLCRDDEANRRLARAQRLTASPDTITAITGAFWQSDVTDVVAAIQAPTLVISRRGDRHVRPEHSRFLASRIGTARLVELPGDDHLFFSGDVGQILDEVEEFLTGGRTASLLDRVLTTVLFVDIVESTRLATAMGDRRWRESLDRFYDLVGRHITRFRGRQVNTTGDRGAGKL